jgi:hypothetical protein
MAGIRTSSHSRRRAFATRLTAKSVGIQIIQRLMGQSNIGTTALYCDMNDAAERSRFGVSWHISIDFKHRGILLSSAFYAAADIWGINVH